MPINSFNGTGGASGGTPNDFNNDTMADILWRNTSAGLDLWDMNGGSINSSLVTSNGAPVVVDPSWNIAGISDFNGDHNADILWQNADGTLAIWSMNGSSIASSAYVTSNGNAVSIDSTWSVAGVGDLNGDGMSDIIWRGSDGMLAAWDMNGATIASSSFLMSDGTPVAPDQSWSIVGVADFNGDKTADLLWRNSITNELTLWDMNGSNIASAADLTTTDGTPVAPDSSWSVVGIGNFNGNNSADVLWQSVDGSLDMWQMNGSTIVSSGAVTFNGDAVAPDATWHLAQIGDFNGDGNSDMLWRNDNGELSEWLMNGNVISQTVMPNVNGTPASPDGTWNTQAKPTNFA